MNNYLSKMELKRLGLKSYGENVLIGKNVLIFDPEKVEIGSNVRIDDFSVLSGYIKIGNYIQISNFCGLYGNEEGIIIEDYVGLASKTTIYGASDDYSGQSMTNAMIPIKYRPLNSVKKVHIKKYSVLGSHVVVLPGVVIEEGCSIGALSLCKESTKPWGIYAGIPIKRIKERRKDLLKLEKKLVEETSK